MRIMAVLVAGIAWWAHPAAGAEAPRRPNILWIIAEDLGPDFSCYGNGDVATPHLDALAAEGRLYRKAFSTAPVCSPSRSALATGSYQTSIGAQHHRSHRSDGYRLPEGVQLIPELMSEAGYTSVRVTSLPPEVGVGASPKQDLNFTIPEGAWDSEEWSDLEADRPFFAQISLGEAHRPYRGGVGPEIDPERVSTLPPYVADHPVARQDWADYLETLQSLDAKVGAILDLLDARGLAEDTLVCVFGDNGREDFRGKSSAFNAGCHVPLIIRWPGVIPAGTESDELVSLIDLSASALALAGVEIPESVHGIPFLREGTPPRELVFTAKDRIEEAVDRVRTVYDGRYRYLRNFMPDRPHLIDRAYYDRTNPVRALMRDLHDRGELTPEQAKVFDPVRPPEELYDLEADPFELRNLADSEDPEHRDALGRLRAALDRWVVETGDLGGVPEDPSAIDLGRGGGGRGRGMAGNRGASRQGGRGRAGGPNSTAPPDDPGPAPPAAPPERDEDEPLILSRLGMMYVGGRTVEAEAGGRRGVGRKSNIVEQAPVHVLIPRETTRALPVVMVPGLGLTSYLYLGTPDGREGWAQIFAREGYPVYVIDEPTNAVSGFDVGPFNAVRSGRAGPETLPGLMVWSNESAWRTWGLGPEPGVPFEDTQYPVEQIDQLYASFTPVVGGAGGGGGARRGAGDAPGTGEGGGGRFGSGVKAAGLVALLEQIGPAILVVHSASGATGVEAARRRPDLVRGLVMVEPVGSPTDPDLVEEVFADDPFLAVFGDHFEVRRMRGRYEACLETARLVGEAGGRAEVIRLPDRGIPGNTHLLMQDRNNREIADMIIDWLGDR